MIKIEQYDHNRELWTFRGEITDGSVIDCMTFDGRVYFILTNNWEHIMPFQGRIEIYAI